ncbi:hypothetical protein ACFO25_17590 [Paenactinomyces guangxiensis]|uniref:Uncharacterized protein n=1 Tax=Paenactinomyces guangxiensis TaxID=1490290 RepID=A0A7W1WRM7_9BACL|nr:hypothetical protein [Paenactinomyces guangxiensis]MBA4494722.1 hypothetical protein [Paenactinomyces guangxiensis]MBH8591806.1 hypothetical protein [Paenactinomyces guangxiensis]
MYYNYPDQMFLSQYPEQYYPSPAHPSQQRGLAQRVAALEATVRQQNQRIRNLERRVLVLERRVFRIREENPEMETDL